MKIKIKELIQIWNTLDRITAMNDSYSPMWDAKMANNFSVLEPIIRKLQERTKDEQIEIGEKKIDIPLTEILLDEMPEKVPVGAVSALAPLIADFEPQTHEVDIDELLMENNE